MAKIVSLTTLNTNFASVAAMNANFAAIVTAFSNTLSLDGSTPNSMTGDLDMNGNQILNALDDVVLPTFIQGKPTNSDVIWQFSMVEAVTFAAGAGSHKAHGRVASTGTPVIDVQKNGVSVGNITFTSSSTGVFSITTSTVFAVGDRLALIAPASQDATLEDISITFLGTG